MQSVRSGQFKFPWSVLHTALCIHSTWCTSHPTWQGAQTSSPHARSGERRDSTRRAAARLEAPEEKWLSSALESRLAQCKQSGPVGARPQDSGPIFLPPSAQILIKSAKVWPSGAAQPAKQPSSQTGGLRVLDLCGRAAAISLAAARRLSSRGSPSANAHAT